jgi:hypothetical protein
MKNYPLGVQTFAKIIQDEYDKPILNNLKKAPLAEIRDVIAAFYSAAKSLDEHLQFVFITGVSKFAKVSVFSGMNSITDISLSQRYGTLCGITQQELELYLIQDKQYPLTELSQFEVGDAAFDACDPEDIDVLSLLVQTGYLTIKDYGEPLYALDFPNYEVKKSFFGSMVARFGKMSTGLGQNYTHKLTGHLNAGQLDDFFTTLSKFFANIPYDIAVNNEKYYQSLFYAILTLLGLTIEVEVRTNWGRVDCVLQTADVIYVIEFKLNDTKEAALEQIHDKQYAQKYLGGDKEVVLLGVEFDQTKRNIGGWVCES